MDPKSSHNPSLEVHVFVTFLFHFMAFFIINVKTFATILVHSLSFRVGSRRPSYDYSNKPEDPILSRTYICLLQHIDALNEDVTITKMVVKLPSPPLENPISIKELTLRVKVSTRAVSFSVSVLPTLRTSRPSVVIPTPSSG